MQKRALKEAQIKGDSPPTPTPPRQPQPPPVAPTPPASKGGGSSVAPIAIALGLGVVGASYYYYTTTLGSSDANQVTDDKVPTTTTTKAVIAPTKKDETTSTNIEKEPKKKSETPAETGNRVTKIPISSKMQNAHSTSAANDDEDHPKAGHRVTTMVPKQTNEAIDTSVTDAAIAALQNETSVTTAKALVDTHSTLSLSTIQELNSMDDVSQLKAKILQLSSELQDRTKWEAVRLKEFLVMKEKEVAEK